MKLASSIVIIQLFRTGLIPCVCHPRQEEFLENLHQALLLLLQMNGSTGSCSFCGILPDDHYLCWCTFVTACRLLLQAQLTEHEVNVAHLHLVVFCKKFEELYGTEKCTPNMHMV